MSKSARHRMAEMPGALPHGLFSKDIQPQHFIKHHDSQTLHVQETWILLEALPLQACDIIHLFNSVERLPTVSDLVGDAGDSQSTGLSNQEVLSSILGITGVGML